MKNWVAEGIASDVNDFTVQLVKAQLKSRKLVEKTRKVDQNSYIYQKKYIT